jgi:hypothetical protein
MSRVCASFDYGININVEQQHQQEKSVIYIMSEIGKLSALWIDFPWDRK